MRIDAGRCGRIYRMVDGRPRTTTIVVDGVEVEVDGPEVTLTIDGRQWSDADLVADDVTLSPDGLRLAWTLTSPMADLVVRMVVEADPTASVVRKWAEVRGRGHLAHVELEQWADLAVEGPESTGEPVPYNAGPVGLGQPLFGPGIWVGIEHPVAENLAGSGGRGATCGLPVAVELRPSEPYRTASSVVGAGGLDDFWDYLDTIRPQPPRLVTLTNNWYHLGATGLMDEVSVRAEVEGFVDVSSRHGLPIDFVTLDDGWEGEWVAPTGLWGRPAPSRFPSGLTPLGLGSPLPPTVGLWLSPFGGYAERRKDRLAWAAEHGYEIDCAAGLLCAAGSRYRAHLVEVLTRWIGAGVGYWKLDGVSFACTESGHGHPAGPGARTAQVDSFLTLVDGIRSVRPGVVVIFTIGSHPSPWWLARVDFLWRGGLDDTEAEHVGSRLDRFDTYIDSCLFAYRSAALPVSALAPFAMVESAAASYRDEADPDGWAHHCWLAAGRGTLHHDLYVAPDSLSGEEWAQLAEVLAWARTHDQVLARSRMVLGDPTAGELYGFVARLGPDAIVCLRNPSARPQTLGSDWPALVGWASDTPVDIVVRFGSAPGADSGRELVVEPFAVVLVEVRGVFLTPG